MNVYCQVCGPVSSSGKAGSGMCGPFKQSASLYSMVSLECAFCVVEITEWQWCAYVADVTCQLIVQLYVSAWSMKAQC